MNLFNKRILKERINHFSFPTGNHQKTINKIINGWQIALSDHDLEKTKEKSVQGEFLLKFFESILGYSSHSSGKSEWNLISSPKTEVDSQEADGSLGFFTIEPGITKAVIELKDAKTSLDKKQISREKGYTPIEQGYLYATKFDYCNWIIVSNFKEIRLYNKTRTQDFYETFDVLKLNELDEFKRFYYVLCKENLISQIGNSTIDALVKETNFQEENITKEFYKKYKETRYKLFEHIAYNNQNIGKVIILEKTQKIIDRIIFVSFCEDLGLLPPNIFRRLLEAAKQSYDLSENKIWNQVKGLFHSINIGNPPMDINKFNGGLFSEDSIFDNLLIKDEVLIELLKISDYDFESDLNVNILGHIFEQSISDIEEVKAGISEIEPVKKEGKRKKEGIYYTPEYITKYIVEQAVGGWLNDKKAELGFNKLPELSEEDYKSIKITKGKVKANSKIEVHIKFWESYREILQNIKVLDPACGSGAFLIQAFDYLYTEGQRVNDELAKLKKGQRQIFDLDKHILTNNIYGVDLNEESVEITKLSLWLKTANKNKELTALDENIKCGNSLIDDPSLAGKKAFKWTDQFNNIISDGGFDVIIGNPPYVNSKLIPKIEREFLWKKYSEILSMDLDLYQIFMYSSLKYLLKDYGFLGFITPNSYFTNKSFSRLRDQILSNFTIINIIDFPYRFFPFKDVNTETSIMILKKELGYSKDIVINKAEKKLVSILPLNEHNPKKLRFPIFENNNSFFIHIRDITKNISSRFDLFKFDDFFKISNPSSLDRKARWPVTNKKEYKKCIFDNEDLENDPQLKKIVVPALEGNNILRYLLHGEEKYTNIISKDGNKISDSTLKLMYEPKLVGQRITGQAKRRIIFTFDNNNYITMPSINIINIINYNYHNPIEFLSALLAVLNSRLYNFLYKDFFGETNTNITSDVFSTIPIPKYFLKSINVLSEYAKKIIYYKKDQKSKVEKNLKLLSEDLKINIIPSSFKPFYQTNWNEFVKELKKYKTVIPMNKKEELYDWFHEKQKEQQEFDNIIIKLDDVIDQEIYKLYNLDKKEIEIIEKSDS